MPQDLKDAGSFFGFANYYSWYIHQLAKVAQPLTDCATKSVERQWGLYQKEGFHQLKKKLCEAPIL